MTSIPDWIRTAGRQDAEDIAQLVNAAYRPASGPAGWTHESALVEGPRTDKRQILDAITQENSMILIAGSSGRLEACVQLQRKDDLGVIGLLAVTPAHQCTGWGKQMLVHAERVAVQTFGSKTLRMFVLSQRQELIAFYQRRGYRRTGTIAHYPRQQGVGVPIVEDLMIETLEKTASATP